MNKIEKLVKEMCPDGVQYKKLVEIFTIRNGYTPSTKNKEFWKNGEISWFRLEDIRCNGRILNEALKKVNIKGVKKNTLFPKESIIISTTATIGEHALIMNDFICNQQFNIFSCKSEIKHLLNIKFYFYYFFIISNHLKNITKNVNLPIINISNLENIEIPVPPIEIQNEIVKILDTFTQLEAELEAELEARDKQYQYYRNKLLDFDNNQKLLKKLFEKNNKEIDNKVRYTKIEELFSIVIPPSKIKKEEKLISGKYPIIDQGEQNSSYFTNDLKNILPKSEYILFGDHTTNIKYVDFEFAQGGDGLKILQVKNTTNNLTKYFYYALQNIGLKIIGYKRHWSILKDILIPIPSLEIQTKIVNILDKLQNYSKDIKTGLPLEIEQRQKQYEYYRNLLLDFKSNAQGGH